jgi:hypothetical protein
MRAEVSMDQAPQGDIQHAAASEAERLISDGGSTPVMVRLPGAELETVDTLIAAGIASSRAEAIRWALARIRARPAYEQLRRHASEIQRLQAEF